MPGVVYGVDDDRNVLKRMITVEKNLLMKELRDKGRSFENTIYEIVVEDTTGKSSYVVVPRQTAFCPCECLQRAVHL